MRLRFARALEGGGLELQVALGAQDRTPADKKAASRKAASVSVFETTQGHSVTVKLAVLVAVPPGLVIVILPVLHSLVPLRSLLCTVKSVATAPSKVASLVCLRLTRVMVTAVSARRCPA
jgi:hypothetical protein